MSQIGVGIIGCGGVTLQNHLPGLALCPETRVVALADNNPQTLQKAGQQTGIDALHADYQELVKREDVHAVIISTPNVVHAPIAQAAIAAGKHVLCEKPLAMNAAEAEAMCEAADKARVRHMTAFTYRFVPAMRYMAYLVEIGDVGQPYHFRSCRLQDWDARNLGWRQVKEMAGTGELGDMLSHRIDYAHLLIGGVKRLVADVRRFHEWREGARSDLEDWVTILAEFENRATGVLESSKVATGRGGGTHSQDFVEINGSEGSLVFSLEQPHELKVTRRGQTRLEIRALPREFLTWPDSPRDPEQGDPVITFRYDQSVEFIQAIRQQRPCRPSFWDGLKVQKVMDLAMASVKERRWMEMPEERAG